MGSSGFKDFIALVLFCGNYMNSGSNKAQSYGFDISFLGKLKDTKSADGQMNFMHFLAQNPIDPRDHFSTYMTAFVQTAKETVEKLNASARQATKGYAELSKWLAFDEVKLPSEEFYKILTTTK